MASKMLVTVAFDGDRDDFVKSTLAGLDALVTSGGASHAALDVQVTGDEADLLSAMPVDAEVGAMISLWEPSGSVDPEGLSLPDGVRVVGAYAVDEVVQRDYERTWDDGDVSPGVKLVCFVRRRPDLTHDAFSAHWRERHGPLALERQPGFWHYVQNHIVDRLTDGSPDLDGIGELHFREAAGVFTGMFDSEEGRRLIEEDTERFLDNPSNTLTPSKEYLVGRNP